jgi:hypothetical protein
MLQGVKDTLVMDRLGKDLGDVGAIVAPQVGDDDPGLIAFGAQGQQKGQRIVLVVMGIDGHMQQVISVDIHGQVDIHPAPHFVGRFVILGDQHIFLIHPDHPTGLDHPEQSRYRQQVIAPGTDPAVNGHTFESQGLAGAAIGAVAPGVHLQGQLFGLSAIG